MMQTRLPTPFINPDTPLSFSFNGKNYQGLQGDTLASALLANNIKLVGRSFKYHRPRGILTAGSEEPNALVTLNDGLGDGAFQEPNTRATMVELYDGLQANPQNYRGSLNRDFMAINDLLSPFLSAGFYYKTFMWPKSFWEKIYEPIIRNAAGLGRLSGKPDGAHYEKASYHCDILVIGGGVAGLQAALQAGKAGAHVLLADEDFEIGGRLISDKYKIDDTDSAIWAQQALAELQAMDNVRIMKRTSILGVYDHGIYGALEQVNDHKKPNATDTRQTLWTIYTKQAILAAGATERPIGFMNNDRPAIMLSNAVRTYSNRFGVACGEAITIFTNNDDGWHMAKELRENKLGVTAIIDSRDIKPLYDLDCAVHMGKRVADSKGRLALSSVQLNDGTTIDSDCLAVAGGWNPNLHLTCHHRGRPIWNDSIQSFVPNSKTLPHNMQVVGSANGTINLSAIIDEASNAAKSAISALGLKHQTGKAPKTEDKPYNIAPYFYDPDKTKKAFVDYQNDVTVKDISLACQEGFTAVEHVKRYTTLGMATDQGKTSNIVALSVIATQTNKSIEQAGTTIYRPPYAPVAIAALAGTVKGKEYRPYRLTPSHQWAEEQGAVFLETGQWLRAQWFPLKGETTWRQSVDREVVQVRNHVGICDVSTLGKIDIKGKDAAAFLNFIYANGFAKLAVGKTRYGLMLREDGIVMDDGTTARLAENHFIMTTTTANAGNVFRHMEFIRQCLMPNADVHLQTITDHYAQFAVAGPKSRRLLAKIIDQDISNSDFPFMACSDITILDNKLPARLFRVSFSGELAYEIAVARKHGDFLVRELMKAGEELSVTPYGTEALGVMRIEKGHPAGNELNGQTSAHHLGFGGLLSSKKDFIGNIMARRQNLVADDGYRLVGIIPYDPTQALYAGMHLFTRDDAHNMQNDQGWISSLAYSPTFGHYVALGFVKNGKKRHDEVMQAVSPMQKLNIRAKIISPHMYDATGARQNG
ncbi:MAG: sarcosine oxidase subunit alpha family protein [Alphaproteobacteria bacterium]|nr:sarcosine oxidase subunit alpha family protein [Alphaproteobacteria bacterium]